VNALFAQIVGQLEQEAIRRVWLPKEGTPQAAYAYMTYQALYESGTDCVWLKTLAIVKELMELCGDLLRRMGASSSTRGGVCLLLQMTQSITGPLESDCAGEGHQQLT
jgi:hypothetical protein